MNTHMYVYIYIYIYIYIYMYNMITIAAPAVNLVLRLKTPAVIYVMALYNGPL